MNHLATRTIPFTKYGYPPSADEPMKDWGEWEYPTQQTLGIVPGDLNPVLFDHPPAPMSFIRYALIRFRKGDTAALIAGNHRVVLKHLFGRNKHGLMLAREEGWQVDAM